MLTPTIKQMLQHPPPVETTVSARGHIKSIRTFKNVGFIDISDGSDHRMLNIVLRDPDLVLHNKFKVGQSIEVFGQWTKSQGTQPFELHYQAENPSHRLTLLGDVPTTYPIQKKSHTLQYLRTLTTLRHRTATLASTLRFRAHVEALFVDFFQKHDFVKVAPPLVTSSDCEGAGEQFTVAPLRPPQHGEKFFGKDAYLTVSTQLHLEVLAQSLNRAWSLSPCFRAEDSNTNRHLSEFWMLEAEICYLQDVEQLMAFVEAMIRHVVLLMRRGDNTSDSGSIHDLLTSRFQKADAERILARWDTILSEESWPVITYTEAIGLINSVKNKGRLKGRLAWGDSILTENEKWLAGVHFTAPVFITHYPHVQKPFYMPRSGDAAHPTVACFDLVLPEIGELVGGSLREHDLGKIQQEMKERNMLLEAMDWYLSTRENGSVPHGGFGLGFERLIAYLTGLDNIRDVSAFPRAPDVCPC